jgi:hypothetical protein
MRNILCTKNDNKEWMLMTTQGVDTWRWNDATKKPERQATIGGLAPAAAGMDLDMLLRQQDEDIDMRKRVAEYTKRIAEFKPKEEGGESLSSANAVLGENTDLLPLTSPDPTGNIKSSVLASRGRIPILSRDYSNAEPYELSKTGKPKHIFNRNAFEQRSNDKIIKALRKRKKTS